MRFFQYQATDSAGRPAEGTIRAASSDAARAALLQGGFRVSSITEAASRSVSAAGTQPQTLQAAVRTRPATTPSQPAQRRPVEVPAAIAVASPSAPKKQTTFKTRPGSDRRLFFLMTQMHSMFKAGVTPATAFEDLSKRGSKRYRESLLEISRTAGETGRISDAMEKYPYLYPPDVVGIIRAGEQGGFLPEAAQKAADQLQSSHRFKQKFGFIFLYFVLMGAIYPISGAFVQGSINRMRDAENETKVLGLSEVMQRYMWPAIVKQLPVSLGWTAICIGLYYLWNTMPLRTVRHRLALRLPFIGKRAFSESLLRFSWVSSMVSRGGVAPQLALTLAADSIPSLELRDRLKKVAAEMTESERTSTALRRSGLLPEEYANIVETGELTGTVPSALDSVAKSVEGDFEARDRSAAVAMITILTIAISIMVLFMLITLYKGQAEGTIKVFTDEG